MDPNANLREQLELAENLADHSNPNVARLAELVESLNGWIVRGGFLPEQWFRKCRDGDGE